MERKTINIILLGAPGSGKGTLAKRLTHHGNIHHFSTGEMLRQAVRDGTPLGKQAAALLDSGRLVPDELIIGLIREKLQHASDTALPGVPLIHLFDGFPRTVPQAEALDTLLNQAGSRVDAVLFLTCSEEVLMTRTANRCLCRDCTFIGSIQKIAPSSDGMRHCPQCGGLLYQRKDDQPEIFLRRMKEYHRITEPLTSLYAERGLLFEIDSSVEAASVEASARSLIDSI